MTSFLFPLFSTGKELAHLCHCNMGEMTVQPFPDEETYIKIESPIAGKKTLFFAPLDHPNAKLLPLLLAADTARDLGAKEIGLIAPYLPYMRQDKQFNPGEGITSRYFASILSAHFDWLCTVDPHLHRRKSLDEIYTIPTTLLHATKPIAEWIKQHVPNPLILGPDIESEQWVAEVAKYVEAPFEVLRKTRENARNVEISLPPLTSYPHHTPVLIDDIISTGKTMIAATQQLKNAAFKPPVCIGIHAIFAENAYEALLAAGAEKVISCNTIPHPSNAIDLYPLISDGILPFLK